MPTALERGGEVLIKPFCPPYYRNMEEAVLAFVDYKSGEGKGTLRDGDAATSWRDGSSVQAGIPRYSDEAMTSRSAVRQWWPSMELVDDDGEDELRTGSSVTSSVHQAPEVARLAPPFLIHCVYTDVEPESRLREIVTGDLTGVLETLFREEEPQEGTRVTFNWYVRVTNPALNLLGYVAARMCPLANQQAYLRACFTELKVEVFRYALTD